MRSCYIPHIHTGNRAHALVFEDAEATARTFIQCRFAEVCSDAVAAWATLEAAKHFKGKVQVASDAFGLIKNRATVE